MKTINKVKYQLLKMREAYEAKKNLTIEIPDDEYERLMQYDIVEDSPIPEPYQPQIQNNYFIGIENKEIFTLSDLTQYVEEKPSTITIPAGQWGTWIYPASWGRPISAISNLSNQDEVSTFNYSDLTLPEGYTGMWIELGSETTYALTW